MKRGLKVDEIGEDNMNPEDRLDEKRIESVKQKEGCYSHLQQSSMKRGLKGKCRSKLISGNFYNSMKRGLKVS
ncbi:hypothetical protein [Ferroglobus sp.]|uniref:hypothetical protein n=1 Tax=Ferroglobus sp. TaxID=2614230 RepID=UPI0025BFEACC|nr:hypothetical protein [Ferroglobus sp.]